MRLVLMLLAKLATASSTGSHLS